jgi:hypothetical protein
MFGLASNTSSFPFPSCHYSVGGAFLQLFHTSLSRDIFFISTQACPLLLPLSSILLSHVIVFPFVFFPQDYRGKTNCSVVITIIWISFLKDRHDNINCLNVPRSKSHFLFLSKSSPFYPSSLAPSVYELFSTLCGWLAQRQGWRV